MRHEVKQELINLIALLDNALYKKKKDDYIDGLGNLAEFMLKRNFFSLAIILLHAELDFLSLWYAEDDYSQIYSEVYYHIAFTYNRAGYYEMALRYMQLLDENKLTTEKAVFVLHLKENLVAFNATFCGQTYSMINLVSDEHGIIYNEPLIYKDGLITHKRAFQVLDIYDDDEVDKIEIYSMMEAVFEKHHLDEGRIYCFYKLGQKYSEQNDYETALMFSMKALNQAERVKFNLFRTVEISRLLATLYFYWSKYSEAVPFFNEVCSYFHQLNNTYDEAICLMDLGICYYHLGETDKTQACYQRALEIFQKNNDIQNLSKLYNNLGNLYSDLLNNIDLAMQYYEKSLFLKESNGLIYQLPESYGNLAKMAMSNKQYEKAIEYNLIALKWNDKHNQMVESRCNYSLGELYLLIEQFDKSLDCFLYSIQIAEEIENIELQLMGYFGTAKTYYKLHDNENSYRYYKKSIENFDLIIEAIVEENYLLHYNHMIMDAYIFIIQLCLDMSKNDEAFFYLEKSKSHSLVKLVSTSDIKPKIKVDAKYESILEQEKKLLLRLREFQIAYLSEDAITPKVHEITNIKSELELLYDELEKIDPTYVQSRRNKAFSVEEIFEMIKSMNNTILIEFFIGQDFLYIFVMDSEMNQLCVEKSDLDINALLVGIENYRREVIEFNPEDININSWEHISKYLIEPIDKYLNNSKKLYFIPYAFLHLLPLHALKSKCGYIIQQHPIMYCYSASLLKIIDVDLTKKSSTFVSYGIEYDAIAIENEQRGRLTSSISAKQNCSRCLTESPFEDFPSDQENMNVTSNYFEEEAIVASKIFSGDCYLGKLATRDNFFEGIKDKDIIHLSCHGLANLTDPLESKLKLYDGPITCRELYQLQLSSSLVTLSACNSGMHASYAGDEWIGFTRSLLYAGTEAVIVTLWEVSSKETKELMTDFYQYIKRGLPKEKALQLAQISTLEKYPQPYFWASFVLIGR